MPELPEVETLRGQLEAELKDERITECEVLLPRLVTHPSPGTYSRALAGCTISGVRRRGKYLLFDLDCYLELVIHLGMSGSLILASPGGERPRHTHLVFHLAGEKDLLYVDPRTFGETALVPPGDYHSLRGLHAMGPEPLEADFTPERLAAALKGKCMIKPALMDQSRIAGIGNIYADEIIHRAGIHPRRRIDAIAPGEIKRLHGAMREVLSEAISRRGSSTSDYVDLQGDKGSFQSRHRVYRRAGEACPGCGTTICRISIAGRSSYFCPACQPK